MCRQRTSASPHVQVAAGQDFEIEWATGHGGSTSVFYFGLLKAEDEQQINTYSPEAFEDYISSAPAGTTDLAQNTKYHKYHRFHDGEATFDPSLYGPVVTSGTNFIPRDPSYAKFGTTETGTVTQMEYKPEHKVNDRRIAYTSSKYPSIMALSKFGPNPYHAPFDQHDVIRYHIPAGTPNGEYIVYWAWRGYYDCIDVHVVSNTVALKYGELQPEMEYTRVDHCTYPDPALIFGNCVEVVTDVTNCIRECEKNPGRCRGIAVVPVQNPPDVTFQNEYNIPFTHGTCQATVDNLRAAGKTDALICYALKSRTRTDVFGEFVETLDINDPTFYSTCYARKEVRLFNNLPPPSAPKPIPVKFGKNRCLTCEQRSLNNGVVRTPKWPLTDHCVDCEVENYPPAPAWQDWELLTADSWCTGRFGWPGNGQHHDCPEGTSSNCLKQLNAEGDGNRMANKDCQEMARLDPECSGTIMYAAKTYSECFCWRSKECCGECSSYERGGWQVYRLPEDIAPADPTCATGVQSADNAFCCSSSCATCGNQAALCSRSWGHCCTHDTTGGEMITRSCNQYGPPCKL